MSAFIPQITTRVTVETDTKAIDESISIMESNEILSQCFGDVKDYLETKKQELDKIADPLAYAVSNTLSAYQSQIISMKHKKTGMMMNSVDVMQDGEGTYMVGNTAMSVDGFPYPLAIEEGTKSHWVAPVTFDALHWTEGGEDRFSKGHMVSGIKADPYVDYSIQNTEDEVERLLNEIVNGILGDG